MRVVATRLAAEVNLWIAARWWGGGLVIARGGLGLEALLAGPGLQQRAVDAEVIHRDRIARVRLREDLPEETLREIRLQQASS